MPIVASFFSQVGIKCTYSLSDVFSQASLWKINEEGNLLHMAYGVCRHTSVMWSLIFPVFLKNTVKMLMKTNFERKTLKHSITILTVFIVIIMSQINVIIYTIDIFIWCETFASFIEIVLLIHNVNL